MSATSTTRIDAFLERDVLWPFIDGRAHATQTSTIDVLRPDTGQVIAKIAAGGAEEIDEAVRSAESAFSTWVGLTAAERAVLLHRLADLLDEHLNDFALLESLDVGKPIAAARGFDVPFAAQALRYFADLSVNTSRFEPLALKGIEARQVHLPYGVCGFIVPWNFPLLLALWGIAPALAAGNTVVVKPAEVTPLSALLLAELSLEAGLPDGAINVVPGEGAAAGAALANHPRLKRLAFTGSPEVGREVAVAAARNLIPAKLELGGKGAAVVFDDVDVKATARALSEAITLNSGQVCCTATRWLVNRRILDDFVDAAAERLGEVVIGSGSDPDSEMGPVVSAKQRSRINDYIDQGVRTGAETLFNGEAQIRGEAGFYVPPVLLKGAVDNICAREEIFGPVAIIVPFDEQDEAIAAVNSSTYGLANSVWSDDLDRANSVAERLVAGNSWINAHNVFAYGLPYGGVNLSGLGGGVNSRATYFDYLRHQTVARPLV